jgi:hypothetical protein
LLAHGNGEVPLLLLVWVGHFQQHLVLLLLLLLLLLVQV